MSCEITESSKYSIEETIETYDKFTKKKVSIIIGLSVFLIFAILVSISVGSASVGVKDIIALIFSKIFPGHVSVNNANFNEIVLWQIRCPRVFMAVIIGASLASTGAVMQGVLGNSLVSPYTLGISSGSAFGAGLGMILGISILGPKFAAASNYIIVVNAFVFGLITTFLVYFIARLKAMSNGTLILAGVAISYLFSALVSILKFISDVDKLHDLTFWLMGGLWTAKWNTIGILFPISIICLILMMMYAWDLNVFAFGDEVATSLGINVDKVRRRCLIISALTTSSCIAFAGTIGFIGLVAPHISRNIIGNDHRFLIPCSALMGSILLLVADTLSRTIISPTEIPVGIVTSLIGAPFFIYILMKERRERLS